jgi:hypothetical protein
LLTDEEMVIASECGVSRAAQLVPDTGENGIKLIQTALYPIGLTLREQSVAKTEAEIHGLSESVGAFWQFVQDCQRALEKARSVCVCVERVCPYARPLKILERFIPDGTSFRVISQPFGLLAQPVGV